MADNKTKLSSGGETHEVTRDSSWRSRFKSKLNSFSYHQKVLVAFIVIGVVATLGFAILIAFDTSDQDNGLIQVDNQEIDQATLDQALEQAEKDPSSIPSGAFMPELGEDYFTADSNASDTESFQ
ncbi:hypothetical protein KC950_00945 [Candidatus Saccharibacteria bacterium]|nr:hypothetical protein [Candidatus Saccharibacteria bacterium]